MCPIHKEKALTFYEEKGSLLRKACSRGSATANQQKRETKKQNSKPEGRSTSSKSSSEETGALERKGKSQKTKVAGRESSAGPKEEEP